MTPLVGYCVNCRMGNHTGTNGTPGCLDGDCLCPCTSTQTETLFDDA